MFNVDVQWLTGKKNRSPMVAVIGVFDGVHRGHQVLLRTVVEQAEKAGALSCVITFDPPPLAVINPAEPAFQITLLREKQALLAELGIQRLLLLPVTDAFLALSADQFIYQVLLPELELVGLVVGHDFRFGAKAKGSIQQLREAGRRTGFWVNEMPAVKLENQRVSSTLIRRLLTSGDMAGAAKLLGRLPAVTGRVSRGAGIGSRELFPTANFEFDPAQLLPAPGVYEVESTIDGVRYIGVASVGDAPTVGTGHDRLIEVHYVDFEGDLRDRELAVLFRGWIREKERYKSMEELRQAIEMDIDTALRNSAENG
jgi:riboflavin kinase / FMN adenylyltransferase